VAWRLQYPSVGAGYGDQIQYNLDARYGPHKRTKLMKYVNKSSLFFLASAACLLSLPQSVLGFDRVKARDQGKRLYERLAGVSPSNADLKTMTDKVQSGDVEGAAFFAMQDLNFYKITIKQMFNLLTTRDFNQDKELTDATALAVGLVRDNQSFDQYLYGDIFYSGNDIITNYAGLTFNVTRNNVATAVVATQTSPFVSATNLSRTEIRQNSPDATKVIPPVSGSNGQYEDNFHFLDLEAKYLDWPNALQMRKQSDMWPLTSNAKVAPEDIAGVISTRQDAAEFFNMGTNRRMFRYTMLSYLCKDMADLHDTSVFDDMVRADVDRKPGGDKFVFDSTCKGCHAGMDGFAAAFSFFDYGLPNQTSISYLTANTNFSFNRTIAATDYPAFPFNAGNMNKQFRQASVFPDGFNPLKMQANGNKWVNRWVTGTNPAQIGWRVPAGMTTFASGKGTHQLGQVLAATQAFSACMVDRVFRRVCFRAPTKEESTALSNIQNGFEGGFSEYSTQSSNGKYNLKALFAKSSALCFGN
jgi:hypothetical protein